jgi:hypothetical protein
MGSCKIIFLDYFTTAQYFYLPVKNKCNEMSLYFTLKKVTELSGTCIIPFSISAIPPLL